VDSDGAGRDWILGARVSEAMRGRQCSKGEGASLVMECVAFCASTCVLDLLAYGECMVISIDLDVLQSL
jgi:hypothetical protein